MGCRPSKARIYSAPLEYGGEDMPQIVAVDELPSAAPVAVLVVKPDVDVSRPTSEPGRARAETPSATNTRMLAMRQMSLSARQPHENRLLASFPSRQAVMTLPPRIRRFSIAAESYQLAAEQVRSRSGSGWTDDAPPVYPKEDEEKTFILSAISKSFLFEGLKAEELAVIVDAMHPVFVAAGTAVFHQGDAGTEFYIVATGCVDVVVDGAVVNTLQPEKHFGELALMHNSPRNATVTATADCQLWALDRRTFRTLVVASAASLIQSKADFLKSFEELSAMSVRQLYRLAEASSFMEFKPGDMIIEQGTPGVFFYMIRSGEVSVLKKKATPTGPETDAPEWFEILRLGSGQYFGEQALLHNHLRLASVRAETSVVCLCLHRDFFLQMFGGLSSSLDMNHSKREETELTVRTEMDVMKGLEGSMPLLKFRMESPTRSFETGATISFDAGCVELSDLTNVGILGEGAFGTVRLVKHEPSNTCYALKVMQKARIVEMAQQRNVIMEKNIMLRAQHPFILKLHRTYQDRNCLYMLLEFCQGGDMFALLGREGGKISSSSARHYAAVVATVFEYLHSRAVAYRDLKPENLVFDHLGHLKVVDFGFAKIVKDRTYTLCGTPEYLSPELVQGSGHHHGVDCWALGILIYEMLCGYSPFADREHNNQLTIYRKIIVGKFDFPPGLTDDVAKDLIRKFLAPKDSKRLGCMKGGFKEVRAHPWFEGFDWEGLLALKLPPPHVPSFTSPTDLSLFDDLPESSVGRIVPYVGDGTNWDAEF